MPSEPPRPRPRPGDRPRVSLVILAWNQEKVIREAIEGAFAQTWQPLEIILTDDASPDGTFRIMEEMAAAYDGPHQVVLNRNPQNLGLTRHVSRFMEIATGNFIIQNAGDDISLPHRVETLVNTWTAGEGRIMALHSAVRSLNEGGVLTDFPRKLPIGDPLTPQAVIADGFHLIGASMAWAREVFDVFGPLPADALIEDRPIIFRAALLGETGWIDEPLLLYRTGGVSDPASLAEAGHQPRSKGYHVKRQRWRRSHLNSYLHDMNIVTPPDAAELRRVCTDRLELIDFELSLADADRAGRMARIGQGLTLAARRRDPAVLRTLAKYVMERTGS